MTTLEQKWIEAYRQRKAFWKHDGDYNKPHAELTSDHMHSDGFINGGIFCEDPMALMEISEDLVVLLRAKCDLGAIDWVVGPAMGAISIAFALALKITQLRAPSDRPPCLWTFAEKDQTPEGKKCMAIKRTTFAPKSRFLVVEDTMTSGGSANLTIAAGIEAGGTSIDFIVSLANRSGQTHIDGREIVAAINTPMPKWKPEECPLCARGSKAIRPKGNWAALNV